LRITDPDGMRITCLATNTVRTAWTRLVIRVVEQRSLRRSRQDLRGNGLFDQCPDLRAEVGEGKQGLAACAQAPPSGAESASMFPQAGGEKAEGRAGHVDAGRVDKHAKPLVETVLLVENPSTRGFICLSGQLPS
jgi:hypothetical protein